MPETIPIPALDDPRLAEYANLRDAELRHRTDPASPVLGSPGLFMAEGELVVRRLIEAKGRFQVRSVLMTRKRLATVEDALAALPGGVPVYLVEQEVMNGVVGFNMHRGVLAVGSPVPGATADAAGVIRLSRLLLILEDLVNHDNLGSIFRNAAALGGPGTGVLLSPRCADPLYRKSLRVSMGHVLSVPFARLIEWPAPLGRLREAGWTVVALSPEPGAVEIADLVAARARESPPKRLALVLGTEGSGLSGGARSFADFVIRIPISPRVDSLNVGVAAAIALHRLAGTSADSGV